jgi:hypothetical protein
LPEGQASRGKPQLKVGNGRLIEGEGSKPLQISEIMTREPVVSVATCARGAPAAS